jgi:hypothetical protein
MTLLNVIFLFGGIIIGMVAWQLLDTLDTRVMKKWADSQLELMRKQESDAGCKE